MISTTAQFFRRAGYSLFLYHLTNSVMKKIAAIITIGASISFLSTQAQEAPQTERTQNLSDVAETTQPASVAQEKVEIDQSALPQPVMDSFKKSEYGEMDIVSVYEVNTAQEDTSSYQTMTDTPADRALDSAVYQSDEMAKNPDGVSKQGDQTVVELSEKVAEEHQEAVGEMRSSEKTEETDQTATAGTLDSDQDKQITDAEVTEKGKELYEGNKYDNFTEANSDAYAEVAKEEVNDAKQAKKYELQVKGDNEEMTLTYDENGELMKADKGSM